MPLNVESFRSLVDQTHYGNRDILVSGEGKNATARLGNFFFSQGKAANNATMKAFKEALEKEYGSLGTHAFDTVLGSRSQLNKSLRACDIQQTLSKLVPIRENRFLGEVNRQIATSPKMLELSDNERMAVFQKLKDEPSARLRTCRPPPRAASTRRSTSSVRRVTQAFTRTRLVRASPSRRPRAQRSRRASGTSTRSSRRVRPRLRTRSRRASSARE